MDISLINIYKKHIIDRFKDLSNAEKDLYNLDNKELAKIFEYYTAILLSQEYNDTFLEYNDINPDFKEN